MAVIFLAITAADAQLQPDEDDNDDQLLQDPAQLDLEVGDANVTGDLTFPVDQFDHTTQATPSSHHLNVYTQLTFGTHIFISLSLPSLILLVQINMKHWLRLY